MTTQPDGQMLGQPNLDEVAAFWIRFVDTHPAEAARPQSAVWWFGDSSELADKLLNLVITGPKRASAGALAEYEADGESLPAVGDFSVVTDGSMRPRVVLETTDVRVGPLSSVDERFAWDEGEGDRSLGWWLDAHTRYFSRALDRLGLDFHADIPVVFERFALRYHEETGPSR